MNQLRPLRQTLLRRDGVTPRSGFAWFAIAAVAALRFFCKVTLERPDLVRHLTTVQEPRKAPIVLSQDEVARLLEAAPGLKYKAALSVAYGAGIGVSEVAALKVSDIDSERMTLRIEQGKGRKALSRERNLAAHNLEVPVRAQAAVTARQVWNASSRRARSVRREVRRRWTLKVLWMAA